MREGHMDQWIGPFSLTNPKELTTKDFRLLVLGPLSGLVGTYMEPRLGPFL
jgi:hypothetical protein